MCLLVVTLRSGYEVKDIYDLYLFFSTYGVSYSPLEVGYRATRIFDSG
jgi:hypothetical protein